AARMRAALDEALREFDDPSNRTTDASPPRAQVRVRPAFEDGETETVRATTSAAPPPPRELPILVGPGPVIDRPTVDEDASTVDPAPPAPRGAVPSPNAADEEPSFGTIDSSPATRILAPPTPASQGTIAAMLVVGFAAVGVVALAVTAMLGGVALWASRPEP